MVRRLHFLESYGAGEVGIGEGGRGTITVLNKPVWRFALWLVFIPVGGVLGDFAGRWLASGTDQIYLFRSVGSVVGACLATWILLKITGPPGPDRPKDMRSSN